MPGHLTLFVFHSTMQTWYCEPLLQQQLATSLSRHLHGLKSAWKFIASPKPSPTNSQNIIAYGGTTGRSALLSTCSTRVLISVGSSIEGRCSNIYRSQKAKQAWHEEPPVLQQTRLLLAKNQVFDMRAMIGELLFPCKSDGGEQRVLVQFSEEQILFLCLILMYFDSVSQKRQN